MDKKMKRNYQMPSIKVVAFKVEEGFQGSRVNVGSWRTNNDASITTVDNGTSYFESETSNLPTIIN